MEKKSRLVYSTESGRICPKCNRVASACRCRKKKSTPAVPPVSDGVIRIKREVKGRKGKTVTSISGWGPDEDLKTLLLQLKRRCGTGGSIKDGIMLIQGDHRKTVKAELEKLNLKVKFSGG